MKLQPGNLAEQWGYEVMSYLCPNCQNTGVVVDSQVCPDPDCRTLRPEVGWAVLPYPLDNHYLLYSQLGRGGMGVVYRAINLSGAADDIVAVKLPLKSDFQQVVLAKFSVEQAVSAFMTHVGGFVRVRDVQTTRSPPYLVMDFVDAPTLAQLLETREGQPLPLRQACEIAVAAARGLRNAHNHKIIHRDVKPSNIFVTIGKDGRYATLLADLGSAKILEAGEHGDAPPNVPLTLVTGTARYMAPEQTIPRAAVDARTDIYSLGIVLYEMLTARWPYPDAATMTGFVRAHRELMPAPMPGVPSQLAAIVNRCLAKLPAQRYPSTTELIADLEAVLRSDLQVQGAEPSTMRVSLDQAPPEFIAALDSANSKRNTLRQADSLAPPSAGIERLPTIASESGVLTSAPPVPPSGAKDAERHTRAMDAPPSGFDIARGFGNETPVGRLPPHELSLERPSRHPIVEGRGSGPIETTSTAAPAPDGGDVAAGWGYLVLGAAAAVAIASYILVGPSSGN